MDKGTGFQMADVRGKPATRAVKAAANGEFVAPSSTGSSPPDDIAITARRSSKAAGLRAAAPGSSFCSRVKAPE